MKGIIDECAAMACDGVSFVNKNACLTYRFRPEDLLRVTSLHQLPERFHTLGKHAFTGEEGLLLLLRRRRLVRMPMALRHRRHRPQQHGE